MQDVAVVKGWLQDANLPEEAADMLAMALAMLLSAPAGS